MPTTPIRRTLPALVAAALCLASGHAARADQFKDGKTAWESGDYAMAWKLWKPLADRGVPDAENGIAVLLSGGEGVPTDYAEAEKWWRRAEAHGSVKAIYNLGRTYAFGLGRSIDYATAFDYYKRAADQGYALAQYAIGMAYFSGNSIRPLDYAEAARWFRKASASGDPRAPYQMGILYEYGLGVPRSAVTAYAWFTTAEQSAVTQVEDDAHHEILRLAQKMSGEEVKEAQRLGAQCRLSKFRDCGVE